MTYGEIISQVEANAKRNENRLREQAHMDYTRARLMTFAVNDPKKMPSFNEAYPFIQNMEKEKVSEETLMENDQRLLIMRAMQIKSRRGGGTNVDSNTREPGNNHTGQR